MQRYCRIALRLILVSLLGMSPTAAWGLSLAEKVKLQAAMQVHIDKLTVDGLFLYFDDVTGDVRALSPVVAHPRILTGDGYYVLCFDFKDDRGADVNVDFFMAEKDDAYIILHTEVDEDETLMRLKNAGAVAGPR